jgi:hypothetical protein
VDTTGMGIVHSSSRYSTPWIRQVWFIREILLALWFIFVWFEYGFYEHTVAIRQMYSSVFKNMFRYSLPMRRVDCVPNVKKLFFPVLYSLGRNNTSFSTFRAWFFI